MSAGAQPPQRRSAVPGRGRVLLIGSTGATALLLLQLRDPHVGGSYGLCPFRALTGLWCPLCGGLRATHDLTSLQVGDALSTNALAVAIVLLGVGYFLYWAARRWRQLPVRHLVLSGRATLVLTAAVVAFTVVRNLPAGALLAPGA